MASCIQTVEVIVPSRVQAVEVEVPSRIVTVTVETGSRGPMGDVPGTRTVNGHPLSSDVVVTKSDVELGDVPNMDFTADVLRSKYSLLTGVIDGCVLSVDPDDNTKVKNTAGHCLYVDCSDPTAPAVEVLTIPEASTVPMVGDDGVASLFVIWIGFARASAGVGAITFSTEFTPSERRRVVVAGRTWATGFGVSTLAAVGGYTTPAWGAAKTLEDLAYALGGVINIDGNDFSAHAGQLTLDKSAGHSFRLFGSSATSRDVPNNQTCPAVVPMTEYRYWAASGTTVGNVLKTALDPDHYDSAGVLSEVPNNNKWTIQQIYYYPGSMVVAVAAGQTCYSTLNAARTAANVDPIVFSSMAARMFQGSVLRARVYLRKGMTDLSEAYIERMSPFVSGGASTGAAVSVDHAILTNLDYASAGHTGFVPDTRTINGIALSANVVLNRLVGTSVNVAGSYTVLAADYVLNVFRTSAGACSIQLEAISGVPDDRVLVINDAGYLAAVNTITLIPAGSDRIDNVASSYLVRVNGASLTLLATTNPNTGVRNWQVM